MHTGLLMNVHFHGFSIELDTLQCRAGVLSIETRAFITEWDDKKIRRESYRELISSNILNFY